jgi:hypothetical protein
MGPVGKLRHEVAISKKEGEPSTAFKAGKIAHQQTLECYCPAVSVLILNCYCPTSLKIFNYILSYRTAFEARWVSLES